MRPKSCLLTSPYDGDSWENCATSILFDCGSICSIQLTNILLFSTIPVYSKYNCKTNWNYCWLDLCHWFYIMPNAFLRRLFHYHLFVSIINSTDRLVDCLALTVRVVQLATYTPSYTITMPATTNGFLVQYVDFQSLKSGCWGVLPCTGDGCQPGDGDWRQQ